MLTQFTGGFAELNVNIANMVNKSRGEYAYTVIDIDTNVNGEVVTKLKAIEGVLDVRKVK
jgi:D-3-phosphoglycerate dehydrogenase